MRKESKRFFQKSICIILGVIAAISSFTGCRSKNGKDSSSSTSEEIEAVLPEGEWQSSIGKIEKTSKIIATQGKTEYQVLLPEDASLDLNRAANELRLFFSEATDAELSVSNRYTAGKKYISLGNTKLLSDNGLTGTYEELGFSGYKIKTIGDSICIYGYSDTSVLYGVYEYLERMFNWDYYYTDTYTIDKVPTLYFHEFDCVDIPDFDRRVTAVGFIRDQMSGENARRMRADFYNETMMGPAFNCWHNSMGLISPDLYYNDNPEWYNNKIIKKSDGSLDYIEGQLCYTAHGNEEKLEALLDTVTDIAIDLFVARPGYNEFCLNMMDAETECKCTTCMSYVDKYGNLTSTVVLFFNRLAEKVEAKLTELNDPRKDTFQLSFYAYYEYSNAPVKEIIDSNGAITYEYAPEMKLNKHVVPMFATITVNLQQSIDTKTNTAHYENLRKWNAIAPKIHVWLYDQRFFDEGYMVYYNSVTHYAEHLAETVKAGVDWIMFEHGEQMAPTAFLALRAYLLSKLQWDIHVNVSMLIDKFFDAMYGTQSEKMKEIFIETQILVERNVQELAMPSGAQARNMVKDSAWWPKDILQNWYEELVAAENALLKEGDEQSAIHVRMEQQGPLYLLIDVWRLSYSENQVSTYISQMKSIFNYFNVTMLSQTRSVKDAMVAWGS